MSLHTLMFGWEYPPKHSGGLGVACQGLVRGLLKHNVQVTLVLPSLVDAGDDDIQILHPTTELLNTIKVMSDLQPYDSTLSYLSRRTSIGDDSLSELYGPDLGAAVERYTALSVEMTKNTNPDVVHCHDWMTLEAGIRAARHHRKPLIAHVHATELDRTHFQPNEWISSRERRGLMQADRIVAVSHYTKNMLIKHYGIPADRIAVVHNGHDAHRSPVSPAILSASRHGKSPLILFLGRMTLQKNPWQFLEIASHVRHYRPDAQFVMAGDGPMLPELIDRACTLGLQDQVVFTGKVNNREAMALYEAADCFVMPSVSEPFGLVALEAIAHGTPVIVSKQSGVSEVLDHAFKVDYWDTAKMTDCIVTILREQPLAQQLRSEAPRLLQRLNWKNQAYKIKSLYQNLIQS
ncbi:glycosyltransferase family 1 protein [Candidatus Peribacteria bacterium]|nr:glycosyltransferase family 1 protein [Candidatus Peribacteria bacterium]